jgi:hypothetical protein
MFHVEHSVKADDCPTFQTPTTASNRVGTPSTMNVPRGTFLHPDANCRGRLFHVEHQRFAISHALGQALKEVPVRQGQSLCDEPCSTSNIPPRPQLTALCVERGTVGRLPKLFHVEQCLSPAPPTFPVEHPHRSASPIRGSSDISGRLRMFHVEQWHPTLRKRV